MSVRVVLPVDVAKRYRPGTVASRTSCRTAPGLPTAARQDGPPCGDTGWGVVDRAASPLI